MLGATQQSKVVVVNKTNVTDDLLASKLQEESFRVAIVENTSWDVLLPKQKVAFVFHRGLPNEHIRTITTELKEKGFTPVILLFIELETANISSAFFSLYPARVMMYMDVYDVIEVIEELIEENPSSHQPFQQVSLDDLAAAPLTVERAKYLTWREEGLDEQDVVPLVAKYKTVDDLMRASDEEIISIAPKAGPMIIELLRQDYHVE